MKRIRITVVAFAIAAAFASMLPAAAHGVYGAYPGRGYHWLARHSNYAELWFVSNNCNTQETTAATVAKNTTKSVTGQREWDSRWPSGLTLYNQNCTGVANIATDFKLKYLNPSAWFDKHGGNYGGHNHRKVASKDYCQVWNAPHPCGQHNSFIHINKDRYQNVYTNDNRVRLILHETGHNNGMTDHCESSAYSVMRDGGNGCTWTGTTGWYAVDRNLVKNQVYPNWPYN